MIKYKRLIFIVMFCALIASPLTVGLTHNSPKMNAVYAASSGEVGYTFYTDQNFINPSEQDSGNSYCFYVKNNNPYEVLICNVPNLDVSELVIPSTVSDGNYTYTITETRDNLNINCSDFVTKLTFSEGMRVITPFTVVWGLMNLKDIIFPSTLQEIKDQAFSGAMYIESLTFKGTQPPTISSMSFDSYFDSAKIYVPASAVSTYKNDSNWSKYADNIEAIPGPKVGDTFTDNGINYVITSVGEKNTVKVDYNTSFTGTQVTIPATVIYNDVTFDVTEISDWAFIETGITEIEIPASVTTIGESAFDYCSSLTKVTFAENSELVTIGDWAFDSCTALTEIEIPVSVTSIGEGAFNYCIELAEIEIPASVTTLCKYAFSYAKLTSVTFAENSQLNIIGEQAFEKTELTEIEIPAGVTDINNKAFYNCANLSVVTILATAVPTTGENIFGGCANLTTIFVPASSLEAYQTAWADYADKIEALPEPGPKVGDTFIDNGINYVVTAVGDTNTVKVGDNTTFAGTSVIVPSTVTYSDVAFDVTEIGDLAFDGCSNIQSVTFANNSKVTTIGEWAFNGSKVTEVKIPASVITIKDGIFDCCDTLSKVTFEDNSKLTTIGAWSFEYTSITEIDLPETVATIGESAFECCQLTEIDLPASVQTIGICAFYKCANLAIVDFAENAMLTTIGECAFDTTGITEIDLPASVTSIGKEAFADCAELTTVKILATEVPVTGAGIFKWCDNLETIFVPASSVDAYKTAWTDYASKIKALHNHAIKETHPAVEPTCLVAGHKAYYECECGKYFSDEALTQEIANLETWLAEDGDGYIAPKGHTFGGKVTYTWNEETHECTASRKCQHTGCNETQTETVTGVYVKDFDATCTANEKGHYEATFATVQEFEKQVTSMFDVPNTAKGHNYGTPTYTWNEDHTKCTATATCSHGDSTITNEGTVTVEDGYAVATFKDSIFETQRFKLPEPTPSKDGLSGGAIAGIAVGSAVVVGLGVFSIIWFGIKKKSFADLIGIFKK